MVTSISLTPNNSAYYRVMPDDKNMQRQLTLPQAGMGLFSAYAVYKGSPFILKGVSEKFINYSKDIYSQMKNKNQIKQFEGAVDKIFESSKLKEKGVQIIDVDKTSFEELIDIITKQKKIKIPKKYKEELMSNYSIIKMGRNSCFMPGTNIILANKNSHEILALPHEMGHAINYNFKGLGRTLNNMRQITHVAPFWIILFALLEKGQKINETADKLTNFIKDNCGKLMFLVHLPVLAEEGLASINGIKHAKNFLPKDVVRNLSKRSFAAWLTYFTHAALISFGASLAPKVGDSMDNYFVSKNSKSFNAFYKT